MNRSQRRKYNEDTMQKGKEEWMDCERGNRLAFDMKLPPILCSEAT